MDDFFVGCWIKYALWGFFGILFTFLVWLTSNKSISESLGCVVEFYNNQIDGDV